MNLEDLKDQFTSAFKQLADRVQDSTAFNQLRDRFENLSPQAQKGVIAGAAVLATLFVLSFPFGYWSESTTSVEGFESRRDLVRRLLKTSREAADAPQIPLAPSPDSLRTEIDSTLKNFQLITEQIKSIDVANNDSRLIPPTSAQGAVSVNLAKLNLRQIVDIGHRLKSFSPSVKMTAMQITPNREDTRYFDVVFKLVSLAVPTIAPPPPPEPEEPPPKRPAPRRNNKKAETEEE